jgi:GntR family transcriptional regulator, transcriptional repressor for pyruvate dehydrogenase complex
MLGVATRSAMTTRLQPVRPGERLSDQVARQLLRLVASEAQAPGAKLPSEARLAERFGVSRTVVREAMSRLKSQGLVQSRQGSGVFVAERNGIEPLAFDVRLAASKSALTQMAEVRRALEAEAAARAAALRTRDDVRRIRASVRALEQAVRAGGDGVEEDLAFHRSIAEVARNPFLLGTLDYLAQFMRGAIRVTRANEARRDDFSEQVRGEHGAVVAAIEAADAVAARAAAERHMLNAVVRLEAAGEAFWSQEGARLAKPLLRQLDKR